MREPALASSPGVEQLRAALRTLPQDEVATLSRLYQRQHDADCRAAIEAEQAELEAANAADAERLTLLLGYLADPSLAPAEMFDVESSGQTGTWPTDQPSTDQPAAQI